ncbi:MAG: hypothetical protein Q7T73_09845 [Beijerinckiaceae bacterium]|nr:hypothetical protein [Beijerinckiaceae bacterium]
MAVVMMTATIVTRERRDLRFPLTWKRVYETETHEVDVEFFRLEASGVRTAIRKRQAYGYRGFEWLLAVEFSTEAGVRDESWYGFRRINGESYSDDDDKLTLAEFEAVEAELQAVIATRMQE